MIHSQNVKNTADQLLFNDAIDLLCGQKIASGQFREVFDCTLMPGYVVKVEKDSSTFHNIREFEVWQAVQYTEHSAAFAQVHIMSSNGRILVMEKTQRPGLKEWPDKIPAYFTDIKRENFGMSMLKDPKTGIISNKFVCHDYGCHLMLENGMTKRLKNVVWGDINEA